MQVFPTPLMLLAVSVFYLWVYARRCSLDYSTSTAAEPD
jgi:hypothetical protein